MNLTTSASPTESTRVAPQPEVRTRPRCAFTVDVEDYYQVDAFSDQISPLDWAHFPSRVVDSTWTILRLLRDHDVRGTFFILGYVAHKHPELVRAIHDDGHEVGCHSYWHRPIHRLTPEEFREDLRQATEAIGELIGEPVTTFRAPTFSIRGDTLWALELLAEAGYRIDSSIFPVRHDKYGIPDADPLPHVRETAAGSIWEFPPTVYRTSLGNVPIAGGGYFRLLPFAATRWMMSRVHLADRRPLMFYIHPWEVDVDQPRLRGRWKSRFRHYQNLRTTARKLDRLLNTFSFGTMTEVLEASGMGYETTSADSWIAIAAPHLSVGTTAPAECPSTSPYSSLPTLAADRPRPRESPQMSSRKLLFLTHRCPYPPDKGDRIRSWNILRHLARRHQVWLGTLADEPVSPETRQVLSETCREFHIQALDGRRWMNGLTAIGTGASLTSGLFKASGLDRWIDKVCRETEFDAVLVYCSSMASYARRPGLADVPKFVDLVDVDSEKWRQYAETSGPVLRRLYERESRLLRQEEIALGRESEAILLTTEAEADLYRSFAPSIEPLVMGNGVDLEYFAESVPGTEQPCDLVFVGALDYRPNVDGVMWFHREVWPSLRARHPELTWNIVGRRPSAEIQRLYGHAGITVCANVPDVRPYLRMAKIAVVPLQVARGVQNKVLEAMAAGVAVAISPDVAKGIPVRHRIDAVIAESPNDWLEELERLLNDSDIRARLGKAGQQYVRASYSWNKQLCVLDQLLDTLPSDKRPVDGPSFRSPGPLVLK